MTSVHLELPRYMIKIILMPSNNSKLLTPTVENNDFNGFLD